MSFCLRSLVAACLSSSHNAGVVLRLSSPLAAAGKWLLLASRPDLMEGRLQEEEACWGVWGPSIETEKRRRRKI